MTTPTDTSAVEGKVETVDLTTASNELLARARAASSGRSARTLTSGSGTSLNQTLIALIEDRSLAEHTASGPATIQVFTGSVVLRAEGFQEKLMAGDWTTIPDRIHDLLALSDAVFLLSVSSN